MRPAIFLDRDGTLIVEKHYLHRPEEVEIFPEAAPALHRLGQAGFALVVVTNQSGVARGMFSLAQMEAFNALIVRRLAARGGIIGAVYACPYHAEAVDERWRHPDHPDRKPNPGMILRAIAEHRIDQTRSFLIGDQPSDLEAARRGGIPGFRFDGGDLDAFVRDLFGT